MVHTYNPPTWNAKARRLSLRAPELPSKNLPQENKVQHIFPFIIHHHCWPKFSELLILDIGARHNKLSKFYST